MNLSDALSGTFSQAESMKLPPPVSSNAGLFIPAIAFVLLLSQSVCRAVDWTTTDGTTYQNVKVISHNDGYVTIMNSDDGARIPLRLLNPSLQKQFNYDATKAAACESATKAEDKAEKQAIAAQQSAAVANTMAPASVSHDFAPISSVPPQKSPATTAPAPNSDNPLAGLKLNEDARAGP